MAKNVTYNVKAINDALEIHFSLAPGQGTIDERAQCEVFIISVGDDGYVRRQSVNFNDLPTFYGAGWASQKSMLGALRNAAIAKLGL